MGERIELYIGLDDSNNGGPPPLITCAYFSTDRETAIPTRRYIPNHNRGRGHRIFRPSEHHLKKQLKLGRDYKFSADWTGFLGRGPEALIKSAPHLINSYLTRCYKETRLHILIDGPVFTHQKKFLRKNISGIMTIKSFRKIGISKNHKDFNSNMIQYNYPEILINADSLASTLFQNQNLLRDNRIKRNEVKTR